MHGNTKHGMKGTSEYQAWAAMKHRCINKNSHAWENYGGRGIKVCKRYMNSFMQFYTDLGPKPSADHSLDRINNNIGYCGGNIKWSTTAEQNRNKRKPGITALHGTRGMYVNHKCRCQSCIKAQSDYSRKHYNRRKKLKAA